jgi:hypothetical protein
MEVKYTVIDYISQTMEVVDTAGVKHTIKLDQRVTVTMLGYPDLETKTLYARDLGPYASKGYVIERIIVEEVTNG